MIVVAIITECAASDSQSLEHYTKVLAKTHAHTLIRSTEAILLAAY